VGNPHLRDGPDELRRVIGRDKLHVVRAREVAEGLQAGGAAFLLHGQEAEVLRRHVGEEEACLLTLQTDVRPAKDKMVHRDKVAEDRRIRVLHRIGPLPSARRLALELSRAIKTGRVVRKVRHQVARARGIQPEQLLLRNFPGTSAGQTPSLRHRCRWGWDRLRHQLGVSVIIHRPVCDRIRGGVYRPVCDRIRGSGRR
jgi:hypothetical protein